MGLYKESHGGAGVWTPGTPAYSGLAVGTKTLTIWGPEPVGHTGTPITLKTILSR